MPSIEAGFTLLTPNVRLSRRLKSAWDELQVERGARTWEPLKVHPLERWLLERWQESVRVGASPDRVLLQEQQALTLWQRAIEQEQADSGEYSLLRGGAAATLAHQARERLLRWQVDHADQSYRQAFEQEPDCASFLAWSGRFQQYLADQDLATTGDCIGALLRSAGTLAKTPLLLLEFEDIPPLFLACINALGSPVVFQGPGAPRASYSARRCHDRRHELTAAADWARALSRQEPEASIGIVLSDMAAERTTMEYLLRRAFDCLGQDYTSLPVNFSTGITLDRAPVVRDALTVLRLGLASTTVLAPTALARSRFLRLPDRDGPAMMKLLRQVSDSGKRVISVADLRYLASRVSVGEQQGTVLGQYLMSMATMRSLRGRHRPSRWLELIGAVLDTWGWPGEHPLDSLEYQQVQLWYDTLEQLAAYDDISGPLSLEEMLGLLQRLLASRVSQPQTADSLVQVLGPLEAAGQVFDHLWVCGLQASRWPTAPRPSPFIPASLQRRLQLPHATAEREWIIAEGLMGQYLRDSNHLVASYSVQLDGVPELPSALIRGWDIVDAPAADGFSLDWLSLHRAFSLEVNAEDAAPALNAQELDGLRGGSALLEDQSQCPFRAFARRRLGAEPLGEVVQGVSPAERGSLLHRALHLLFTAIPDSEVLGALNADNEAALVAQVIGAAMDDLPRGGLAAPPGGWRELESRRLERLLRQWLAVERQREAFRVEATEADLRVRLEALELRLRVDRIDRMPDGSAVIMDYKSGTCRVQDWLGDRPVKPQLLLYALARGKPPAALAFAQLRVDQCAFVGVGDRAVAPGISTDIDKLVSGDAAVDSWESLNRYWRNRLQMLAREFLAGRASVDPLPGACTWCGLGSLCRISEGEPA